MTDIVKPTPMPLNQRAGLPEISRRVGTHGAFKAAMMRGLRSRNRPGLTDLRTNSDEDWTIALLDAWAGVLDSLTFYSERINNESYIGTATETFSVQELAALVGYSLSPATASEVDLAFVADDTVLTRGVVELPAGLAVKSIPEEAELPQTFETLLPLRLKIAWNAIRPLQIWPQRVTAASTGFAMGDTSALPQLGAKLIFLNAAGIPQVIGTGGVMATVAAISKPVPGLAYVAIVAAGTFQAPTIAQASLPLAATNQKPAATSLSALLMDLQTYRYPRFQVLDAAAALGLSLNDLEDALLAMPRGVTGLLPQHLRDSARLFGHNTVLERPQDAAKSKAAKSKPAAAPSLDVNLAKFSDELMKAQPQVNDELRLFLDRAYPSLSRHSIVVMRGKPADSSDFVECWTKVLSVETVSVEALGMSGEVTCLHVPSQWQGVNPAQEKGVHISAFDLRQVSLHFAPQALALPPVPIAEVVAGADLMFDRADLDIAPGQLLSISGERADLPGAMVSLRAKVADVQINGPTICVQLALPLDHPLQRQTVVINGNIARASHGETVSETLGSGDARAAWQAFTLRSGPLTYLSAQTPTGRSAALQVWVDGVRWHEAASFEHAAAQDRIYVVQTREDGKSSISFGDGVTGARLPTGDANVSAVYRKGAGAAGRVRAGQISLMVSKPRNLRSVSNPIAASGGSNAEVLEDARKNAPQKLLTLGRVVSLSDAEDFARGFAGISKAKAGWSWTGGAQEIFLTVSGEDAAPLPLGSGILRNLALSLQAVSAPGTRFVLRPARVVPFTLRARLRIDPDHLATNGATDAVIRTARMALQRHYEFNRQAIGGPVRASDVLAVLQGVQGVVAVDLDQLYRTDALPIANTILRADVPRSGVLGEMLGAEILILSPDPVALETF